MNDHPPNFFPTHSKVRTACTSHVSISNYYGSPGGPNRDFVFIFPFAIFVFHFLIFTSPFSFSVGISVFIFYFSVFVISK